MHTRTYRCTDLHSSAWVHRSSLQRVHWQAADDEDYVRAGEIKQEITAVTCSRTPTSTPSFTQPLRSLQMETQIEETETVSE